MVASRSWVDGDLGRVIYSLGVEFLFGIVWAECLFPPETLFLKINLFIYSCVGSSLLHKGFL